jgi:uncharacterized SAM-binding protein YcdF (DUF218 family)
LIHGQNIFNMLGKIFAIILLLTLIVTTWLFSIGEDSGKLNQVDIIVCLSGGSGERLIRTAELYQEGWAKQILLTKTKYTHPVVNDYFKSWKEGFLLSRGVEPQSIYQTTGYVSSTYDECVETLEFMKNNNLESAIILTDLLHLTRVKRTYHTLVPDSIQLIYIASDTSKTNANSDQRLESILYRFLESIKLLMYVLKY